MSVIMKPKDLELISKDGKYYLKAGNDLLKTPNGNVIESKAKALLENIIADFEGQRDMVVEDGVILEPRIISAYVLDSSRRDFMDKGDKLSNLPGWLMSDPVFQPLAGHPLVAQYQEEKRTKIRSYLKLHGISLKAFDEYSKDEMSKIYGYFAEVASHMSGGKKSCLVNLAHPNGNNFVATFVYLLGRCSEREWAEAVFSRTPDVCRIIGERPLGWIASIPDGEIDDDRQNEIEAIIREYQEECQIAKRYLDALLQEAGDGTKPVSKIRYLIKQVDRDGQELDSFVVTRHSTDTLKAVSTSTIKEERSAVPKKDPLSNYIISPSKSSIFPKDFSMPGWLLAIILIAAFALIGFLISLIK